MSGDARLSYHAVPRIIQPSPPSAVPHCLSRPVLEDAIRSSKCLCCTTRLPTNATFPIVGGCERKSTSTGVHDRELESRTRPTNQSSQKQATEDCTLEPVEPVDVCSDCRDLLVSWESFEAYLSSSRININVREVGSWCNQKNETQ